MNFDLPWFDCGGSGSCVLEKMKGVENHVSVDEQVNPSVTRNVKKTYADAVKST